MAESLRAWRGLRVVDLTDESGHLAGRILADLGAEVLKIEPPGGDAARRRGPFVGGEPHPDAGAQWLARNLGKRSVVLDLDARGRPRAPARRWRARRTCCSSSCAPGAAATRLGLGMTALRAR